MGYGDSMQWTEVRYGRRGRRFREGGGYAGSGDRLRTGSRGMDSAFPVGWRRGPIANIMSNPPVPPRDFSTAARSVRPPRGDGFRRGLMRMWSARLLPAIPGPQLSSQRQRASYGSAPGCSWDQAAADAPTDPLFLDRCHTNRGTRDLVDVRDKREGRRVLQNGSVLPESQARFLEEVVELSSEPASSVVRDGPPSCSQQGTRSVPSGPGQEPQVLLSTAAADGGAARAVWEVATGWRAGFGGYDDRPSAGDATDWGCAREELVSHGQTPRSPKVRRTQQRSQVPVGQGAVAVGGHPEGEAGVLTC
ncbi:hypothetical protein Q5P01_014247 [Channa striata]|uniref:Uncharacterized protein n=1 Tax=Channa striata TaxID=64152 RepID=A0AA88SIP5_CHASR|nr:hypothetical protein Q5P01_014247 [Channa striata]